MKTGVKMTDVVGKVREHGFGIRPPGHRLPADTRLGPVHLQVTNLNRSISFYRDVLGFTVFGGTGDKAVLGSGEDGTSLVELYERPGASSQNNRSRLGLYHFAVLLPDRTALGHFAVHLIKEGVRVGSADHLVSEALYLQDPDGLGIEVYADRPRTSWQHRDGELLMDTKPLDMTSLLREEAGRKWTGFPAGTVIGHVHLHVGDLDEAAVFYHGGLGFDVVVWSYPGALFLSAGGYHHHLGLNTWAGPNAQPPRDEDARLLEWTILVPGRDEAASAAKSIEAAGYEVNPEGRDWLVTDPWQTVLRIVSTETV